MSNKIEPEVIDNSNEMINWIDEAITKNYLKYYEYNHFYNIQEIVKEIVNELKLHRQMKSYENIIHFCGVTTKNRNDNSKKYQLVMEYADDGTLRNYLKEHFDKLTWNDKLNLALQLARAVLCLHDEGITHRDLNPNNVLVHQGIIKLSDFGLSKRIEESFNLQSKLFDMVVYVDPKVFDQIRYNYYQLQTYSLNKKSDIYSIGILLWELSSGRPPFCNELFNTSDLDLALEILQGLREKPIPNTPEDYLKLYTECWDNEPDNRPTINEVITKLNIIISNQLLSEHQVIQNFDKINLNEIEPSMSFDENNFNLMIHEIFTLLTNIEKDKVKEAILNCFNDHNVNSQDIYDWLINHQDNSDSIVLLGEFNYFGIVVNVDRQKAFELYEKAANLGNSIGLDNLGNCYDEGIGVNVNKEKAFELYQKAASLGNTSGINNLGYCYDYGVGTNIDKQKACELYQKAANLGNITAQYNLATMYVNGDGALKNIDQAIYWFEKAAEQGDEDAQNKLEEFKNLI
ncbi:kinase-like domain-containing protein [Rhizophagus irregularis DAOM 181602=DAOM 197198]|nr:kinase-like domain-containing protein [Rhizophagus irregularis DAOM 181602=DAOM 197198]